MGKSQQKAQKKRKQGQVNTGKGKWPGLKAAKGYQDKQRNPLPPVRHLQTFLREKPLARAIPNPVATPRLPPQEKIREIRRFLWYVATQKFPSAADLAASTVNGVALFRLYGLTTQFAGWERREETMAAENENISAYDTEAQINQFFIRVITHAFKTWRHMMRLHRDAKQELTAK